MLKMCHIQRKTVNIFPIPHVYSDLAPPENISNCQTMDKCSGHKKGHERLLPPQKAMRDDPSATITFCPNFSSIKNSLCSHYVYLNCLSHGLNHFAELLLCPLCSLHPHTFFWQKLRIVLFLWQFFFIGKSMAIRGKHVSV